MSVCRRSVTIYNVSMHRQNVCDKIQRQPNKTFTTSDDVSSGCRHRKRSYLPSMQQESAVPRIAIASKLESLRPLHP
jgi:hypothetical protein